MSQVTKRALEASLKHLLLQKPLNKITINDIAEDCGINRMTFYYHFKDIYDLVEWSCQEDASRALAGKKTYETWQQGFLQILQAVLDNKPFILNVYRSVSREQVEGIRGEWMFPIFADQEDANDPRCQCSECGSIETPLARHRFCPSCGAPMTDEAVDIRLKELEALKDGKGD